MILENELNSHIILIFVYGDPYNNLKAIIIGGVEDEILTVDGITSRKKPKYKWEVQL